MKCEDVDVLGCLDGRAPDEHRRHVEVCDRCREERRSLERQVALLLPWFREAARCPTPERQVDRALEGSSEPAGLEAHLSICERCRAEWTRLLDTVRETEALDSPAVRLPHALARELARVKGKSMRSDPAGGRIIDGVDRFRREVTGLESLPAAAQPEDLTDTTEESESREEQDDEPEG